MTLAELKEHRLFRLLTEQEREWMREWIDNGGNAVAATKVVFNPTTEASAQSLARKVMRRPQIEAVINVWLGESDEQDELLSVMWSILRDDKAPASAKVAAARLIAEVKGDIKGRGAKSPEKNDLDELFKDVD